MNGCVRAQARSRTGAGAAVLAVLALVLLAGCTGSSAYDTTTIPTTRPATSASPAPSPTATADCADPTASYRPPASLPGPGDLPAGSSMARIRERGRLVAGVSADTLLFAARDPRSGRIQGFDIDLVRRIAEAILGDPDKVELRVINASQRIPLLQDGTLDVVVRTMTITCDRWRSVAFSAEYYRAGQKLLVPEGSRADSLADLAGKRVCAPNGSTSLAALRAYPKVVPVGTGGHTTCLAMFQQGDVDAITGDDAVLAGLAAQDPYAEVVGPPFSREPYGVAIASDRVDLVRFVNAVLARWVSSGGWQQSYDRWLAPTLGKATAPAPRYGRR